MKSSKLPVNSHTSQANTELPLTQIVQSFPLRRLYFIIVALLTLFSIFSFSISSDNIYNGLWKFTTEIKVSTITLTLLLIVWLPILLPWLVALLPRLRSSVDWLRSQGIEEIETSIFKIKIASGVKTAAETYESKVIGSIDRTIMSKQPSETKEDLNISYRDAISAVNKSGNLSSEDAMHNIDMLVKYYDRIRRDLPSGSNRTRLFSDISATIWSIVPSVKGFPTKQRLLSASDGERLSAYKYIEWQPTTDNLQILLSRCVGMLEQPYGQYAALLALRRVILTQKIDEHQEKQIRFILNWYLTLNYPGGDRTRLISNLLSILDVNNSTTT